MNTLINSEVTINCNCGQVFGEACNWSGAKSETVLIQYMPEYLRSSHSACGNSGQYPYNGAIRIRVEKSCAELIVECESEWVEIVG